MTKECPKCQAKNPEDSQFCNKCATPLKPAEEETVVYTKTLQVPVKSLTAGTVFAGKYKIIEKLGKGGMGAVFKAEDSKLKRTVALKFLSPAWTSDSEARERFIHEAQAASALDHPNICTVHEIEETEEGEMYISMAYYHGESLKEKIKRGPLDLEETIEIAVQIGEGLAKAHEQGIVHRDVKSANIMITNEGMVKIVDFGLAKLTGITRITKVGQLMGTVDYMSPEQARGEDVDERTDVWSLAVILYEMISGRLPFRGANEQAIVYSILHEDPAPVRGLAKGIPIELERIMRRAFSKDRARRFADAREMADVLQALRAKLMTGASLTTRQMIFRKSRKRLLIGSTAGICLLATVFVTWMLTRPTLAFSSRDKLLVADVENLTDDSVFDLALRTAIEADLQQSLYATIFDKSQVADTLLLMKVDPSSRIDEKLGSEICRFAAIRAMILPRILSVGEAYELQAIVVDPRRKRYVDRIRIKAQGREDVLLSAIDKLARQVRVRLGESIDSIQEADEPVVKVTTSSWEALHYLAMGQAKWNEYKFKDAVAFFELALEKDPHFVSARGSIGLLLIQFLGQKERGKEMLKQALIDAEGLPQDEYLLIKAVHRRYVEEDLEGALDEYRLLMQLYPDLMQPVNNSGIILRDLGRYDEAVNMFEKAAELAPRNSIPLGNLWFIHIFFRKDPQEAEDVARRMVNLGPEIANYQHSLAWSLVAQGRFEEALPFLRKTLDLEPQHPYGLPNMAHVLLAVGAADEAALKYRELRELISQGRLQGSYLKESFNLAFALLENNEPEEARKVAAEGQEALLKSLEGNPPNAQNLSLLGQFEWAKGRQDEARRYLDQALKIGIKDPYTTKELAELYALLGEGELAIKTLKSSLESGYHDPFFPLIFPAFQSIRNDSRFRSLFNIDQK